MDKKYNFSYEPVSVYASAMELIRKFSSKGAIHIDLGCGYAAIARQIENDGARYVGFDANSESVETLKQNGIEAYELDLTQVDVVVSQLKRLSEDYSIVTLSMLDVIEHLDFDCGLLGRLKEAFSSEQQLFLILSVPNSSHIDVAIKLFSGAYDYLDTGLLDRTHTVVYTEKNLSNVTEKNGWKQVAANDYHLEFSEQFLEYPVIALNRDGGIGRDFRRLKGILDPNCDVYQFVRAYIPAAAVDGKHDTYSEPTELSVSLVFPENVKANEVLTLAVALSTAAVQHKIELVLPEKILTADDLNSIIGGGLAVSCYQHSMLDEFVQSSLNTRYWTFVTEPLGVCVDALIGLFDNFDGSRGTPLIELANLKRSDVTANQFELFASLDTNTPWNIMIPTGYASQFHDLPLLNEPEGWLGFVRRAVVACGANRICVEFVGEQATSTCSINRLSALSCIFTDPKLQSYVMRSDDWAHALRNELQGLAAEIQGLTADNEVFRESNMGLQRDLGKLQVELSSREANLEEIINSKSWTLTRPLRVFRRTASRFVDVARAFLRRDRASIRGYARAIYLRFPVLKFVWSFYTYRKMKLMRGFHDKTFSSDNIQSLNALSHNRSSEIANLSTPAELTVFPDVDISVVAYNSSRWVHKFLESLASQNYPLSNIHFKVVDNGSSDNTVELFQEYLSAHGHEFASAEVIQQENLGFGLGHDRAIRKGQSDYCLIVNLDLEFLPDSIVKAVTAAVNDRNPASASWEFRQVPFEHPKYYDPVTLETNWSSHACVLLRRDAYLRCGGYDHAIFMYGEDVELSYRLRSYGYVLRYLPSAAVIHHTYEEAGEVKPLQFAGSVLGNTYIRLRYGSYTDRFVALALYAALFVYPSQFPGSKKMLLRNVPKLLKNIPHFLRGKGTAPAKFPFRGYDYELIRDGAFWQAKPFDSSSSVPKVTVITRTYRGRGMFLKQAMQSVFHQTYPNIELLVAEDGGNSQLELVESISKCAPSNVTVRFLANEKIGRSGVGNAAMAVAQGQYYMFLDDDDLLFSDHVETLMQCLSADTSLDAAYSLAFEVTTHVNDDKSCYVEELFYTPPVFRQVWDYKVMQHHNFIPIQSIMFKKELYQRWGGFDVALDQLEDWSLWLRYGYEGNFRYIEKTTSLFRTPADTSVRADRHALLHNAYEMAVRSANERIAEKVGSAQ